MYMGLGLWINHHHICLSQRSFPWKLEIPSFAYRWMSHHAQSLQTALNTECDQQLVMVIIECWMLGHIYRRHVLSTTDQWWLLLYGTRRWRTYRGESHEFGEKSQGEYPYFPFYHSVGLDERNLCTKKKESDQFSYFDTILECDNLITKRKLASNCIIKVSILYAGEFSYY